MALEEPETLSQQIGCDTWEALLQIAITGLAHQQLADDEQRPTVTYDVQRSGKGAVLTVCSRHRSILLDFLKLEDDHLGMTLLHQFGSGPAVVLIHGIPGSAATWRGVAERLAVDHLVLVPDLVGFGATDGTPSLAELRADAQAEALATALDRLSITAATVVGHDFGGPVALHLLAKRHDLVSALGLLATNAFADTAIPFPLASVTWPVIGPVASRLLFSRTSMRMLVRRMVGMPRTQLDVRSYLGDMAQTRAIRLIFTDSLTNLAERYRPLEAVLSNASVPAAVIWGDNDPFFPLAHGERTAAVLDVELRVLSGAGHALPDERPDEVATVIKDLARRAEAAA